LTLRIRSGDLRSLELLAEAHGVSAEIAAQWLLLEALRRHLTVISDG
jgi:hypothetical protein